MRYNAPRDALVMRRAALGPAAIAARGANFQAINRGLPQKRFVDANMMIRGGSMGALGVSNRNTDNDYLGCLCGPGDPQFLGAVAVPASITQGPIATRIIQLRRQGMLPKLAMLDAISTLAQQGMTTLTPDAHLQIAAGMQPFPGMLSGLGSLLGALGLAPIASTAVASASLAASSAAITGMTAAGLAAAVGLGQTVIPIPAVGAVIGAIVFEASHLLKRHVGKAEAAWANQAFYNSLKTMNGRDYDEHQFSEAFKGMMDTGNNIIPGCGPDRHKNPDCFMQPLAATIAQGYLRGAVPLTATTRQVFQSVVVPWLQSGAGGLVNWANLSKEPIQQTMIQAATDRYLADQPMTRGDMQSYGNVGLHTPTLVQALQPILRQPTTSTPQVSTAITGPMTAGGSPGMPSPYYVQPGAGQPIAPGQLAVPGGPAVGAPVTTGPAYGVPAPYNPPPSGGGGVPALAPPGGTTAAPGTIAAAAKAIPWGVILAGGAALLS